MRIQIIIKVCIIRVLVEAVYPLEGQSFILRRRLTLWLVPHHMESDLVALDTMGLLVQIIQVLYYGQKLNNCQKKFSGRYVRTKRTLNPSDVSKSFNTISAFHEHIIM